MKKPPKPPRGGGREPPPSRWQRGTDVRGVIPPGRRLAPEGERRATRWAASGIRGVVPPGGARPEASPSARWTERDRKRAAARKAARALERARAAPETSPELDLTRPMAGFVPAVFADAGDPDGLEAFLERVSAFVAERRPPVAVAGSFEELIHQSRAPFELVVAFTILSAIIGKSTQLRRRHALALERGAKAFFNLARRIDPGVRPPRGLAPETLDAIFHDLPGVATQLPFAYATDAFCRQLELLREDDPSRDRALLEEARALRRRFIERRAFGDRPLRDLFPWTPPDWTPPA